MDVPARLTPIPTLPDVGANFQAACATLLQYVTPSHHAVGSYFLLILSSQHVALFRAAQPTDVTVHSSMAIPSVRVTSSIVPADLIQSGSHLLQLLAQQRLLPTQHPQVLLLSKTLGTSSGCGRKTTAVLADARTRMEAEQ